MLDAGVTPETARSVLPNSLKTTIDISANLRKWYHILKLRTAKDAHPDIRYMMHGVLMEFSDDYPEIFGDLFLEVNEAFLKDFGYKMTNKYDSSASFMSNKNQIDITSKEEKGY